jgi:hypothetical protein
VLLSIQANNSGKFIMNLIWDFISRIYANIIMMILGDAPLDIATVLTIVCVGGTVVVGGLFLLVRLLTPQPSGPLIIQTPAPETNGLLPIVILLFVLFVIVGGGLFLYAAR